MSRVLRSVRKRKKGHTLGAVDVIDREEYAELEVDAKVELIRSLVPLGLRHIEELLDEEVTALAGERYARKAPSVGGRRHGSNPGTVGLAGQRVPIRVPRIRHVTEREIPRRSYEALHGDRAVNDLLLRRVLYGISCRNDAAAAEAIPRAIGLSGSTVSRAFIQASATKLRELQERDLSGEDVVALVLDGKTFAEATMVVALGITMTGDKRFLGVVETDTENEQVLTPFLRSLVERGLDVSQGLLVIVDGGKGLRAAVRKAFRHRALVQRCQWHTRENVVSYVAKREGSVARFGITRENPLGGPRYAANPNTLWISCVCPTTSPFAIHRACPLRSACMISMPRKVRHAVVNRLKPSIGRVRRLMNRWSCSMMLFRYLHWRRFERGRTSPSCRTASNATG